MWPLLYSGHPKKSQSKLQLAVCIRSMSGLINSLMGGRWEGGRHCAFQISFPVQEQGEMSNYIVLHGKVVVSQESCGWVQDNITS